jgi:serine/threonine protein kinase
MSIVNKYEMAKEIGRGKFGKVFEGIYQKTNENVAIKMAIITEKGACQMLKHEVTILYYLYSNKCLYIPLIYWYGKHNFIPTLILSYYDQSLDEYFYSVHKRLSTEKIDHIITQITNIIENIHMCYVIHCDIKPQNFMLKNQQIYLIDFGLSKIYVNEKKHIIPIEQKNEHIIGTPKFVSSYIHDGWDPSCRDDFISVEYIRMYLTDGYLPWENVDAPSSDVYSESHILHPKNIRRKEMKVLREPTV